MTLRIGFDTDGVLADFASKFHEMEIELCGSVTRNRVASPEEEANGSDEPEVDGRTVAHQRRRRNDAVWQAICATPDFWTTLQPTDPDCVRRIHEMMLRRR